MDDPDESCVLVRKKPEDENSPHKEGNQTKRDSLKKGQLQAEPNMCRSYGIVTLILFLALIAFLVFGYVSSLFEDDLTVRIVKPLADSRPYKYMRLSNEMKIILLEDKDADRSGGTLALAWSPQTEPKDLPGLGLLIMHNLVSGVDRTQNTSFEACLRNKGGNFVLEVEEDLLSLQFYLNHEGLYSILINRKKREI